MTFSKRLIKTDIILLGIILIIIVLFYDNECKDKKYTVAKVYNITSQSEGDAAAMIIYKVNNHCYNGSISSYKRTGSFYKKGDRVFIEYCEKNPKKAILVYGKDVPEKLTDIPVDGWQALPY